MQLVIVNRRPQIYHYRKLYHTVKRVIDVLLCLVALPVVIPLAGILAVLIRLDSPGPALFVQERIGKGGRPFMMYKFRTMSHDLDRNLHKAFMTAFVKGEVGNEDQNGKNGGIPHAFKKEFVNLYLNGNGQKSTAELHLNSNGNGEVYKPFYASEVTRLGHILRKTSLDELPQIINVLKGEMSIVGPRPYIPAEYEAFKPWHKERVEVLPGMTGLAQVRGRSSISFDTIVMYDIEYVGKQSLALDMKILLWTALAIVSKNGAE
jgi:lipopolysaccharide/colanic/teichoic acid biosynthesis glycosyltransferase